MGLYRSSNEETENPWYKTMNRIRFAVKSITLDDLRGDSAKSEIPNEHAK